MVTSKTLKMRLANFAAFDEPFQPEDRGLVIIGIKAGVILIINNNNYSNNNNNNEWQQLPDNAESIYYDAVYMCCMHEIIARV